MVIVRQSPQNAPWFRLRNYSKYSTLAEGLDGRVWPIEVQTTLQGLIGTFIATANVYILYEHLGWKL